MNLAEEKSRDDMVSKVARKIAEAQANENPEQDIFHIWSRERVRRMGRPEDKTTFDQWVAEQQKAFTDDFNKQHPELPDIKPEEVMMMEAPHRSVMEVTDAENNAWQVRYLSKSDVEEIMNIATPDNAKLRDLATRFYYIALLAKIQLPRVRLTRA